MNHLHRDLAPITDTGWDLIDDEAKGRLTTYLAARKLVDFDGPHGWSHSATNLGRIATISGPSEGVAGAHRKVLPLVELRAEFKVSRVQLDDADRGATRHRPRRTGRGGAADRHRGERDGLPRVRGGRHQGHHREHLACADRARRGHGEVPHCRGPGGGRAPAVGDRRTVRAGHLPRDVHPRSSRRPSTGAHLLFDHLHKILGGPLVWSPGVDGGVVLSLRGGDFILDSGQDLSIGYLDHDADVVRLYIEESFSFRVLEPDAAVAVHTRQPERRPCLTPYPGTGHSLANVESLTISQLAHEAGVHVETVRYYERRGLLREPPRTPAGYRQYSTADLRRLQFIARAKQLGFTLAEVARLAGDHHDRDGDDTDTADSDTADTDTADTDTADSDHDGGDTADSVLRAARAKLRALDERQRELDETRARLSRLIDICEDPMSEDCLALRVRS